MLGFIVLLVLAGIAISGINFFGHIIKKMM